jgi:hypothetical protein
MSESTKVISPLSRVMGLFNRASELIKVIGADSSAGSPLDGDMLGKANKVVGLLKLLSPIKPTLTPAGTPSTSRSVMDFVKSAASSYRELKETFSSKVLPPIDKVLAVTVSKQPEEAINEFATKPAYATIAGAAAVSQARQTMLTVSKIVDTIEESDLKIIDSRLKSEYYSALASDADAFSYKAEHAIETLMKVSPNSFIAHGGSVRMHQKLEKWDLQLSDYGWRDMSKNRLFPTRMGTTPVTESYAHVYPVPGATTVVIGSPEDAPLGMFRNFLPLYLDNAGHSTFPPKKGCYDYSLIVHMRINTTAPFGETAFLNVAVGKTVTEAPLEINYTKTYKWPFRAHFHDPTEGAFTFAVPYYGDWTSSMEMWISSTDVFPLTMTATFNVLGVVGEPKGHSCEQGAIDYRLVNEDGRRFIQGGDRWSSLLGKVKREYSDDPNFSLRALWHSRLAADSGLIEELVDAALQYSGSVWGTTIGAPSVNDKYAEHGVTLASMSNIHSWLYSDGVFAGKSQSEIDTLLNFFVDDLKFITQAVDNGDRMRDTLVAHNGFNCRCG